MDNVTKERWNSMKTFIAVDLETTGLSPEKDFIIEIGALKYENGMPMQRFSSLVKPPVSISDRIYEITGIDDVMVADAPDMGVVMNQFLEFVGEEQVLLGHNLRFDYSFLKTSAKRQGVSFQKKGLDTLLIARKVLAQLPQKKLANLSEYYGIVNPRAHRAFEDAQTTAKVYLHMYEEFGKDAPELFLPREMQYKVKKVEPITIKQKNYLLDLLKYHKIQGEAFFGEKGKKIDDLTKSEASKLIDEVISHYGRIMVTVQR